MGRLAYVGLRDRSSQLQSGPKAGPVCVAGGGPGVSVFGNEVHRQNEPRILSNYDFANVAGSELTSGQRMDCNEGGRERLKLRPKSGSKLRCANVYEAQIAGSWHLLFNQMAEHGVVVLNAAAYRLWRSFEGEGREFARGEDAADWKGRHVRKLVQCGLLELDGERHWDEQVVPEMLEAWFHVTNQCNLRCTYCYVDKSDEHMSVETGIAAVDGAVRSALRGGFNGVRFKYAGGESTLRPTELLQVHGYARGECLRLGLDYEGVILTNGVGLPAAILQACRDPDLQLMISIDGVTDLHNSQRRYLHGSGSTNARVMHTIELACGAGIRPFLSITVSPRSLAGLPQTVRFALDRRLPFNLNFSRDMGQGAPSACISSGSDEAALIEGLQRACDEIELDIPDASLLGTLLERTNLLRPHRKSCGAGDSYLVVDPQGRVAKCHTQLEATVTDVYHDDPLFELRNNSNGVQNLDVDARGECKACAWKYQCGGGCPRVTLAAAGRYETKSPYCNVYKALFPRLLELEGLRLLKLATVGA